MTVDNQLSIDFFKQEVRSTFSFLIPYGFTLAEESFTTTRWETVFLGEHVAWVIGYDIITSLPTCSYEPVVDGSIQRTTGVHALIELILKLGYRGPFYKVSRSYSSMGPEERLTEHFAFITHLLKAKASVCLEHGGRDVWKLDEAVVRKQSE